MAFIKIVNFSDLVGKGWLDKEKGINRPIPKFSDINKKYEKIQQMMSNLKKDNENYIIGNLMKYGKQTDNTCVKEYYLKIDKDELTCQNDTIYFEPANDYIQIVNNMSLDEQMNIIKKIDKHVSKLKPKDVVYI